MKHDIASMVADALHAALDAPLQSLPVAEEIKIVEEARRAHPRVPFAWTRVGPSFLLFRPIPADAWAKIERDSDADRIGPTEIRERLVRGSLVFPTFEELAEMCRHRPLLLSKLAAECMKLSGNSDEFNFRDT